MKTVLLCFHECLLNNLTFASELVLYRKLVKGELDVPIMCMVVTLKGVTNYPNAMHLLLHLN